MTVDDAKAYLRLESAQEDALLTTLVASARSLCEAFLGQHLLRRSLVETLVASGEWQRLGASPVAAITTVERVAADGTVSGSTPGDYAIDIDPAGDGWVRASGPGRLRVTYRAGLAEDEGGVPAAIAQGITRLAAHLYVHRDGADAGPPAAVAALWRPFRRVRLRLESRA